MASINTQQAKVAVGKGVTWGTAVDLTGGGVGANIHTSALTIGGSRGRFTPNDNGFDNFISELELLEYSVDLSLTFDLTYQGIWKIFVAALFGTVTGSPAENNVGEGDYLHDFDPASSVAGNFLTLAYLLEDDRSLEFPSVKPISFAITQSTNGVGVITVNCIADRLVTNSPVNSQADIDSLSYPTYQAAVLGDTNHYLRLNTQSGGALSSADDMEILNYNFSFNRPLQRNYPLRGANTKYTTEPAQLDVCTGQLSFLLNEIDDGSLDILDDWNDGNEKKAEIFIDGDQIGSGDNTSIKLQMPRLSPSEGVPAGHDIPSSRQLMQPTATYDMLKASAAPTGMTGVTNMCRMETVETRSAAWF